MKKKNLRYSLATLVLIALIIGVISSATEIRPIQQETQQESVEALTTPVTPLDTNLLLKPLLQVPLTAEESSAYLEARDHLWPKQKG